MAKYVCGPSVLRLDGKGDAPIQPGETFDVELSLEQEALLLAAGAITIAEPVEQASAETTSRPVTADVKE